jgi:glutaconate CoA-transferase subunit A
MKIFPLSGAARLVEDGQMIALGGNSLTRSPAAFVRELARQERTGLCLIKTAGAYDVDLLCAAGVASEVRSGYIGFENLFGLAPSYRGGVESGRVKAVEHTCYSVIAGLRASAYGLSSQPMAGLQESDVPALTRFQQTEDPYTGEQVYMIPRIRPDWAILHVQHADAEGNARIDGGPFEDVLMSRAAVGVILTAEQIVDTAFFQKRPERTNIPAFMVRAVVYAPGGAAPGSCFPLYDTDEEAVATYLEAAADPDGLRAHLSQWEERDRQPVSAVRQEGS